MHFSWFEVIQLKLWKEAPNSTRAISCFVNTFTSDIHLHQLFPVFSSVGKQEIFSWVIVFETGIREGQYGNQLDCRYFRYFFRWFFGGNFITIVLYQSQSLMLVKMTFMCSLSLQLMKTKFQYVSVAGSLYTGRCRNDTVSHLQRNEILRTLKCQNMLILWQRWTGRTGRQLKAFFVGQFTITTSGLASFSLWVNMLGLDYN